MKYGAKQILNPRVLYDDGHLRVTLDRVVSDAIHTSLYSFAQDCVPDFDVHSFISNEWVQVPAPWTRGRLSRFIRWWDKNADWLKPPRSLRSYANHRQFEPVARTETLPTDMLEQIEWMWEYILYHERRDPTHLLLAQHDYTFFERLMETAPDIQDIRQYGAVCNLLIDHKATYRGLEIRQVPWLKKGQAMVI